nr:hypothetical protein [Lithothamnion corallioides]
MQYFLNPRLQVNYKLLCKYDIIDKEFLNSMHILSKLNFIKMSYYTNFLENQDFSTVLNKEFLTFQRIGFQLKPKKSNFDFRKVTITLRKSILYMYLELLLHTYFLNKHAFFTVNQKHFKFLFMNKNFNSFFSSNFLSNLGFCTIYKQNILICLFLKNTSNINLKNQLNYYFVPMYYK